MNPIEEGHNTPNDNMKDDEFSLVEKSEIFEKSGFGIDTARPY